MGPMPAIAPVAAPVEPLAIDAKVNPGVPVTP
jgi:hypothetical protein